MGGWEVLEWGGGFCCGVFGLLVVLFWDGWVFFDVRDSWLKLYMTACPMLLAHPFEVVRRLEMVTGKTGGEVFWKCFERPGIFFSGALVNILTYFLSSCGFRFLIVIIVKIHQYYLTQLNNKEQ